MEEVGGGKNMCNYIVITFLKIKTLLRKTFFLITKSYDNSLKCIESLQFQVTLKTLILYSKVCF